MRAGKKSLGEATVSDFGRQWLRFDNYKGYISSIGLLADHLGPLSIDYFRGKRVLDVGAGTGRFCVALLEAGAAEVLAVEPSQAVDVIRRDLGDDPRITILNITADKIPININVDCAISLGVLHHIPEPAPVVTAVYQALQPGGKFIVWLYGSEGIKLYLFLVGFLRLLTKPVPDHFLEKIVSAIDIVLVGYMALCRRWRLPLHNYLNNVLAKFSDQNRRVVIYDQLRPAYAKYYSRPEAEAILTVAPFEIEVHDRRGYSWIVIGTKPAQTSA